MRPLPPSRIALLAVLLASLPVQAQIYQYKDASGRTVISDRPPPAGKAPAKTIPGPAESGGDSAPAANGAAAAPKSLADRELEFKKRQQEQKEAAEKAQKEAANKAARKDDCERAQRQLQVLESGERVVTRDAQGERVYIEDSQRAAEIDRARKFVADNCK